MIDHEFELSHDWLGDYPSTWLPHIAHLKEPEILEIGAYEGRATIWFLQHFPNCHITSIDTFEGGNDHKEAGIDFGDTERRFRHNTAPWAAQVTLRKGTSAEWLRCISTKLQFDVILVDGSHMAADVYTDIALAWPLLASSGVMILDDYGWGQERPPHERPAPAIDAFLTCFAGQYELLEKGYQVIVKKL